MSCFDICTMCNESSHQGINTLAKSLKVNNRLHSFGTYTQNTVPEDFRGQGSETMFNVPD